MGELIGKIVSAFLAETLPALLSEFIPWLLKTTLQIIVWVGLFKLTDRAVDAATRGTPAAARRVGRMFGSLRHAGS